MKNLDINNLTKVDLVRGIIRLTNTTNNLLKSCGNNLEHGCLAESTLRTKKREFLEKQFEQAWEWFYKAVCENYDVIDADIDKQSLDAIKAKSEKAIEENFKEYRAHLDRGIAEITELIHNHIINQGMLDAFPDIKIDDVIIISLSDERVRFGLKGYVNGEINYYHCGEVYSPTAAKNRDIIDFNMASAIDLDSERGHQQLFLMSLLSYIGSNGEIRTKMNEILDDIPNMNAARIRMNDNIQRNMAEGIDEILLPYVNGVALGLVKVNRFFKRF